MTPREPAHPQSEGNVINQVQTRREALLLAIRKARNARMRSPLRKELWRLDQLADLLKWWMSIHRAGEPEQ